MKTVLIWEPRYSVLNVLSVMWLVFRKYGNQHLFINSQKHLFSKKFNHSNLVSFFYQLLHSCYPVIQKPDKFVLTVLVTWYNISGTLYWHMLCFCFFHPMLLVPCYVPCLLVWLVPACLTLALYFMVIASNQCRSIKCQCQFLPLLIIRWKGSCLKLTLTVEALIGCYRLTKLPGTTC